MGALTNDDYHKMRTFGRLTASDNNEEALKDAIEYMGIAGKGERIFLRFEFHEGVRNYARDQRHVEACMALLDLGTEQFELA